MSRMLVVVSLLASGVAAAELPKLESRVVSVAAWKNGLAAVTREVRMPKEAGDYELEMPPPLHGSLWVALPAGARLAEIVAEDVPSNGAADSLEALLCASVGQVVGVERSAEAPMVRGRLLRAPCADDKRSLAQPRWDGAPISPWIEVETDAGIVALPSGSVAALTMPTSTAGVARGTRRRTRLRLDAVAGRTFQVSSLVRGIAWAPAARLDLEDPSRGTLMASAVLANEVETLDGVALDLVSGPARFSMANVYSPLMSASLVEYFQALTAQGNGVFDVTRVALQNRSSSYSGGSGSNVTLGDDVEASVEDASLRRLEGVSLAKGAASWRPLWTEEVDIEHVMTWAVPSTIFKQAAEPDIPGPRHVVRVHNATPNPWTTQPVELVSGGMVIGQSRLTYTPAGASADVVIAEALDLRAEASETEKGPRVQSGSHERTAVEGELRIENLTGRDVMLEVVKEIEGTLTSTEPAAKDVSVAEGLERRNPRHRLSWHLPLGSGETLTLRYAYTTWVR